MMSRDCYRKLLVGTTIRTPSVSKNASVNAPSGVDKPRKARKQSAYGFESEAKRNTFRKKHKIRVKGVDISEPFTCFPQLTSLGVPQMIVRSIYAAGFEKPSPVQMQVIPILISGRDVIVSAPTGTGKTLAYLASLFAVLRCPDNTMTRGLIVAPTRELARQIHREALRFGPSFGCKLVDKRLLHSWTAKRPTILPDIVVTTPKRLLSAVECKCIDLSYIRFIVFDEADLLLGSSFIEQIDSILGHCTLNGRIQKALFSATISTGIEDLARQIMIDPVKVSIGRIESAISTRIAQELVYVGGPDGKIMALERFLAEGIKPPVIVFCRTIDIAGELFTCLKSRNLPVGVIHSSLSQADRDDAIKAFAAGSLLFLIATDLLSRGLDFPEVSTIINYDFPDSMSTYVHRIGRTGRSRRQGRSITLFTDMDVPNLRIVVNVMRESGCLLPEWMLDLIKSH